VRWTAVAAAASASMTHRLDGAFDWSVQLNQWKCVPAYCPVCTYLLQ
jgi:hypothetical protein